MILEPGLDLTLRPLRYPVFYEMYKNGIRNTWTVDEVDFVSDLKDLHFKLTPAECHLVNRLVAFFATGDSIVGNNICLNLYRHLNAPEARMYLSRQIFEEAVHVQFYLTLLDTYIPDVDERHEAFKAIDNIPSIQRKAEFAMRWLNSIFEMETLRTDDDRRKFLLNLICFATCIEGLFFYAAFAYVYFMRSKGLLNGLASGTNWVFRDESAHMNFALTAVQTIRKEYPQLFDTRMQADVRVMIEEAVSIETQFAEDLLQGGVAGLSVQDMRRYLEYVADQRLQNLGLQKSYGTRNPFPFMDLQDVQELSNFFERRVASYQVGVSGTVKFDEAF
ncbi:MAG: ribonucleotide-diphosphate reductase subunit beta [SAR202 cluster bacterium]|nr:ribonucleotide-diphosphate reductase subunit beta [SAR202 cluster bacterium]